MCPPPNRGTGPGAITPDGSPVEFFALVEPGNEPDLIRAVLPRPGSILDLGAGTGRITRPLVELGYEVVAVDESAEMLARVQGAQTIRASIQNLRLDRRFDAVLLASYLVNTPDDALRHRLLTTARRHVLGEGAVLIQWEPPEAYDTWCPGKGRAWDGGSVVMTDLDRPAPGLFAATLRYQVGDLVWTQSFTSRRMTDEELESDLSAAGLAVRGVLTDNRTWIHAVPGP